MLGRWGDTPLVAVTVCLTLGIACSWFLRQYSFAFLAGSAAILISAAALSLRRGRHRAALALGLASIGMCGLLLALAGRDGYPDSDLRALLSHGTFPLDESLAFDGCVLDDRRRRGDEDALTVDLRAIRIRESWLPCQGAGILKVPAAGPDGGTAPAVDLQRGDRVRGWATWRVPRNYVNPGSNDYVAGLERRGVYLVGKTKSARLVEVIPGDCATYWSRTTTWMRNRLRSGLRLLEDAGKAREAAILASIVIGDYTELGTGTREMFQNTGTYHVLVVSGLHVAWMAWVFVRLFQLLRVPQEAGRALSAAGVFLYTCIVGFQASISRCLWMFVLYLIGQTLFRRGSPTNMTFAAAFILVSLRPDWILDPGFQLSFISVVAICQTAVPFTESYLRPALEPGQHAGEAERLFLLPGRWHRLGRCLRCRCELLAESCGDRWGLGAASGLLTIFRAGFRLSSLVSQAIVVSAAVQLWLGLLLARHFNRLSWIAPVANIVAVPVSSLVLAAGMASALLADLPLLAKPLLDLAVVLSSLLLRSNEWMSQLPGAWQRCPTPPVAWVLTGLVVMFAWSFLKWRRLWIPALLVAASLGVLSAGRWPALAARGEGWRSRNPCLRLTFLDVGEGDSTVIRLPDRRIWIVDAGGIRQGSAPEENASAFDIGEAVISRYLWWEWIRRLDRLVISHPDTDHSGGARTLLHNFPTGELVHGSESGDALLAPILDAARKRKVPVRVVQAGGSETAGGLAVQVLNPQAGPSGRTTNENSVVLRLIFGDFTALLTGDLEKSGEKDLAAWSGDIRSLLLKVAHHGSRAATLDPFLEKSQPRWAVVSVGRSNPFGHPSREVLIRLLRHGARPYLTLDQGAIAIETDGRHYVIESCAGGLLETGLLPPGSPGVSPALQNRKSLSHPR